MLGRRSSAEGYTRDMDDGDEVFLEGLRYWGYHGVNPEERTQGQRFVVDVRLAVDLAAAAATDDLRRTVSYSAVQKRVRAIVEGEPRDLIETVAGEVAETLLAEFPLVGMAALTVRKPEAPMRGVMLDAVGVRIVRRRGDRG